MRELRKPINPELICKGDKVAKTIIDEPNQKQTGCRDNFFPKFINHMGYKIGVEIGTDEGIYAKTLIKNSILDKLYCIDVWYNDKKYSETQEQLAQYIDNGRVELIKKLSSEACFQFDKNSIDFLYIDGDHSLLGILGDLLAWTDRVKLGGIIAGHDYKDGRASGTFDWFGNFLKNKVKIVMDDFCPRYGYSLRLIQDRPIGWWFIKNKECECQLKLSY